MVVAAFAGHEPADGGETGGRERGGKLFAEKAAVLGVEGVGLPGVFGAGGDVEVEDVAGGVDLVPGVPVPDLVDDTAVAVFSEEDGGLHGGAFEDELVVVADAGEEEATGFEFGGHGAGGGFELGGIEVGQGVVEGGDDVEGGVGDLGERGHVGDVEVDLERARGGFVAGAGDGGGAEVGGGDAVAKLGEAEGLGADAAGAVEDMERVRRGFRGQDGAEDSGLAGDGGVPIVEDEVVVIGEGVVEAED